MLVIGLVALAVPVAAQGEDDGGIGYTVVCGSELGTLLSGLFTLITIALLLTFVWRVANGIRKMSDPRPQKKQNGREEAKGGLMALAGALVLSVAPQIFSALGLSLFDCISLGGV